ncbi:hypothetical protein, partial [Escherichia coli]|uniref:hypothetical protein n=1 Tax=Escherichia coli TaxID=562 RepID=UPI0019D5D045
GRESSGGDGRRERCEGRGGLEFKRIFNETRQTDREGGRSNIEGLLRSIGVTTLRALRLT